MSRDTPSPDADEYRRRLYEVRADDSYSFDETLDRLLAIGCEYLGVENGHVKRIDQATGTHEVLASVGDEAVELDVGALHDHATTYCRQTIERETPLAVSAAGQQGWADDPAYREHGLECYLGATVTVEGATYGTVCFVAHEARAQAFAPTERAFVELVARIVGRELETRQHASTLAAYERELRVKTRALEEASVGITIADATAEGVPIVYANAAFERLTGYDRSGVIGRSWEVLHGPTTDENRIDALQEALAAAEPWTTELLQFRADGAPFWSELTIAPVEDETGQPAHYVGVHRDVTARKRRERVIAVLNRVLRHNIRNGINATAGFAELLVEQLDGEPQALAETIVDSAYDLVDLGETARQVESVARTSDAPEPRDAVAIASAVAAEFREVAPDASIDVVGPAQQRVLATEHLRTALAELVENAIVHGGASPTVEVAVSQDDTTDDRVRIAVRDDGPGLPKHERRILQGRSETKLDHGSGLGLWLVHWVVAGCGGYITTAIEDGTTVRLHLRPPSMDDAAPLWLSTPTPEGVGRPTSTIPQSHE